MRRSFALVVLVLPFVVFSAGAADWIVPEAPIRFELKITDQPSADCAGVVAFLPDGGLLPRGTPAAVVVDQTGTPLPAECVWHNPQEGFGVVFLPPANGDRVVVYLKPSAGVSPPTASPFCPSLLLYTETDEADLDAARRLAREDPPGKNARCGLVNNIAHMENPFGPDDKYISYYTGWLPVEKAGTYYFATVSDDGSECRIDGNPVASWPGTHNRWGGAKGQYGKSVELTAGRHRVQYFHFNVGPTHEMDLVWRKAGSPGESLPETVPASAFIHSGHARVVNAQLQSGAPVAAFTGECVSYLWLGSQPVNLFQLRAQFTSGNPTNTVYVWDLGTGMRLQGPEISWLIEGSAPQDVTLIAAAGQAVTKFTKPVYADTPPPRGNVNYRNEREDYRQALLARCRAIPADRRPCADWSPDLWATLIGVTEPYAGLDLLREIFERSRPDVIALKPADRRYLEDAFVDLLRRDDPNRVLPWLDRLALEEMDNARRFHWQLTAVEFYLYDRDDWKQAKALAESLEGLAQAAGPDGVVRLLVRYGDIARLQGQYDDARKLYSEAQDRYQKARPDWRAEAVRETSFYETVHSLIDQGVLYQARDLLAQWEIEFPLSKLAGDYPIAEAEYDIATGRLPQAVRELRAYRQGVDMTSALPHAMEMELHCLAKLNRNDELHDLVVDIKKRFPNLELAREADRLLAGRPLPKKKNK